METPTPHKPRPGSIHFFTIVITSRHFDSLVVTITQSLYQYINTSPPASSTHWQGTCENIESCLTRLVLARLLLDWWLNYFSGAARMWSSYNDLQVTYILFVEQVFGILISILIASIKGYWRSFSILDQRILRLWRLCTCQNKKQPSKCPKMVAERWKTESCWFKNCCTSHVLSMISQWHRAQWV